MSIYSIYKITNLVNDKVYIGFTKNTKLRFRQHIRRSKTKDGVLYGAMRKYGIDNFSFETIFQSMDREYLLQEMEPFFIKEYNSFYKNKKGYNMTIGGGGHSVPQSNETKEKLSILVKLQWENEDQSERIRNIGIEVSKKWKEEDYRNKMLEIRRKQWKDPKNSHIIEKIKSKSQKYIVYDPERNEYFVDNLKDFCKEHNLNQSCKMYAVANGKLPHYKKWRCVKVED